MEWKQQAFQQLSNKKLYQILKLRVDIFVVEQECAYPEMDGHDEASTHLWVEEDDEIIAYCRLVPAGDKYPYVSIGRVLVNRDYRSQGYAQQLMNKAIAAIKDQGEAKEIFLQGQEHLLHFYSSFGFKEISHVYMDDGIPHVDMLLKLD
ncbi:ElaA protein [Thalassobacillus cyri]|uniref:ElaA protein n=1 Tax=Thalassobacillus cyri TaxID=571932 RepID=A0A1H4ERY3_9BACI|nr:GNAT family N-acetyltransferase [Thalassobacillus cyri]SEA87368.1 ElaA protein [Thalassobacillus cyri]